MSIRSDRSDKVAVDEAILAAARESIRTVGMKRTSIAEIARRAGVSRPTIYRRYADIGDLIAEVLSREVLSRLDDMRYVEGNARERIIRRTEVIVQHIVDNGLFISLQETDPEHVVKLLTAQLSDSHRAIIRRFIVPGVKHGQEDGSIRAGDAVQISIACFFLIRSVILGWRGGETIESIEPLDEFEDVSFAALAASERAMVVEEPSSMDLLRILLERYLAPNPLLDAQPSQDA